MTAVRHVLSATLAIAAVTLSLCPAAHATDSPSPRIIGGTDVAAGQHSYVARLTNSALPFAWCTGALISPEWILSANHCDLGFRITVHIGAVDYTQGRSIAVDKVVKIKNVDLALMHLSTPVTDIAPLPLAPVGKPAEGTMMDVVGYGMQELNGTAPTRMKAATMVVGKPKPVDAQGTIIPDIDALGGPAITLDAVTGWVWNGDSGSPGIVNGRLLGVASRGSDYSHQAVYALANEHLEWITSVTGLPKP